MAKKQIIFKLLAYSDAAGKYNPDAPLNGNEDNFYVDDDLSDDIPGRCQMDKDVIMSDCGCLMVVADGMGGMNAGEVASDIAISTVKEYFAPGKVSPKMAQSSVERRRYLEMVIKDADRRVKTDAKENPEHEGMGSTIILAWIVGDKVTISWCGDSRAYKFNPVNGIEPLSTDHSYVQELVNQKVITYEDTFEHPQGNIVTRSLGDPNNSAKPDTREFDIYNEDIILLCSDGLSGVLRDKKTKDHNGNYYPGDNIEDIIASHTDSLTECREALMSAAEKAEWYDNVTVLLCQIESGAGKAPKYKREENSAFSTLGEKKANRISRNKIFLGAGILLALVILLCGSFYYLGLQKGVISSDKEIVIAVNDTITNPTDTTKVVSGEDIPDVPIDETKPVGLDDLPPKVQPVEKDWKEELIKKLQQIKEPTWKESRVKVLIEELRSAPEKNKNKLTTRVNDLLAYNGYLLKVRKLQGSLRGKDKELSESLEKKILEHNIGLADCKNAIGILEQRIKSYDGELNEVSSNVDNPETETPDID